MPKYNAFLINPFTCTVSEVTLEKKDISLIYKNLDCRTFTIGAALTESEDPDVLMVDDEGLFVDMDVQRFFKFNDLPPRYRYDGSNQFAGKGLIVGSDTEGGSQAPKISIEALRGMISWESRAREDLLSQNTGAK
jgi:hypothetical protein